MPKNLGIIVPYRDRAQHLQAFLPHLAAYFSRSAPDVGGDIFVQIVEQESGLDFNRGLMKNIGYALCKDKCDYVCFHDVDYLPIWADYSEPTGIVPIVWYGAESIIDTRGYKIDHNFANFFGGAVLFAKADFEKVNGYANAYWGWGFEDTDIVKRCLVEGVPMARRKGTFQSLPHVNQGYDFSKKPSEAHLRNQKLFAERFPSAVKEPESFRQTWMKDRDGLSTLEYSILQRKMLPSVLTESRMLAVEMVLVSVSR